MEMYQWMTGTLDIPVNINIGGCNLIFIASQNCTALDLACGYEYYLDL